MDRSAQLEQESIPRLLWKFSLPAIVGMVAQALYNIVDRIFVGQAIGPKGIAGIAVSFPFMLILLAVSMLVGFGAAALISIRLGQRRRAEAELALGNAALLLLGVSAVVTALGLALLDPILRLSGASEAILPYARDYLSIIVGGSAFQIVGFGLNAIIRGEGNPRVSMYTMLIGVLLNVILAPTFIFGFGWGMRGAAIATVLSQAVSASWVLGYFLVGKSALRFRARDLRLEWRTSAAILAIGSPPFALQLAASVLNSILNNQLRIHGGDLAVSVMGVIYAVVMLILMPIFGINQGAQPIIGYNYGARRYDRVKKTLLTAVVAATVVATVGFVIAMAAPVHIVRLFDRDDLALAAMGDHAIRICFVVLPVVGF
ncbi:MAG: MATE family efflux transporter, partial [Pirellulales bacterium]